MQVAMKPQILSPQTSPHRGRGSIHPSGDEEDEEKEAIKAVNYCPSLTTKK